MPLGFPDRALAQIEQLTALADRLSHPFSLGNALTFGAAITYQMRRQADRVEKCASAGLLLADKYGFLLRKAQATVMQGWAMAQRSLYDRGISLIQEGMETWDATGAEAARSYHFGLLADAYRLASCPQLGLQATRRGLDSTHRTGERWWLPELHRLQGELQWAAGTNGEAAEASFRQVLEESNQQKARSLQLRAATSLARLQILQGKPSDGREQLARVFHQFDEGSDTPDLQEAQQLLATGRTG